MIDWAESHGYTNRCPGCGQLTDSDFCSSRCESETHALDLLGQEEEEDEDMIDGPEAATPYGDENNEPNISHGDAKHERAEYDRERKEA